MWQNILIVGLGGFIGAIARYALSLAIPRQETTSFPTSTLLVNLIGSLLIGLIFGFFAKQQFVNEKMLLFLTIGVCGSFTTFSTFSLELFQLFSQGKWLLGSIYSIISFMGCLLLVFLGCFILNPEKIS